jgi:hypothetical protein
VEITVLTLTLQWVLERGGGQAQSRYTHTHARARARTHTHTHTHTYSNEERNPYLEEELVDVHGCKSTSLGGDMMSLFG